MWSSGLLLFLPTVMMLVCHPVPVQSNGPPAPAQGVTPRGEIRLSEYAKHTTLLWSGLVTGSKRLAITSETVQEIETGGHLTIGALSDQSQSGNSPSTIQPKGEREDWRAKVLRQKDRVTKVRGEIVVMDARIAALRSTTFSGRDGTARRETKLAELMGARSVLSHQLATERARLVALIRSAREQGAEPGWFR